MSEAARLKGVSYHTVSRAVRQGRLPVSRLGRMALIAAADLESWQPMRERAPLRFRQEPEPIGARPSILEGGRLGTGLDLARDLSSLIEVFHAASTERSTSELAMVIARQFSQTFALKNVSVWQFDPVTNSASRIALVGQIVNGPKAAVPLDAGYRKLRSMIDNGRARVSAKPNEEFFVEADGPVELPNYPTLLVPLRIHERSIGLIAGTRQGERLELTQDQLTLAQVLGNQAALALDHANLRQSETLRLNQLTLVLDQMKDQVRACDVNGRINLINRADLERTGRSLGGPALGDMAWFHPSVKGRFELDGREITPDRHPLSRALKGESVEDWVYNLLAVDGKTYQFEVSARPIIEHDQITGAVTIARDRTELVEKDRQIQRLEAQSRSLATYLESASSLMSRLDGINTIPEAVSETLASACDQLDAIGGMSFRMLEGEPLTPRHGAGAVTADMIAITDDPIANSSTIYAISRRVPISVPLDEAASAEREVMIAVGATELVVAPLLAGSQHFGALHVYRNTGEPMTDGQLMYLDTVTRHVSQVIERIRVRHAYESNLSRLNSTLEHVEMAALVVEGLKGRILTASPAVSRLWGIQVKPGMTSVSDLPLECLSGRKMTGDHNPLLTALRSDATSEDVDVLVVRSDDARIPAHIQSVPTRTPDGTAVGAVFTISVFQSVGVGNLASIA